MNKKELVGILDMSFKPLGYNKKGNDWMYENEVLIKTINLQKSAYGNLFYLNLYTVLKKVPLVKSKTHIFERLCLLEEKELVTYSINELLNLDLKIEDHKRSDFLMDYLKLFMSKSWHDIQSEETLLCDLEKRSSLSNVAASLKKYFDLI